MEWTDTSPDVQVKQSRYQRLLGYPAGYVLSGRGLELSEWAREWYSQNGHPWIYARRAERVEMRGDSVEIEGAAFTASRLLTLMTRAGAHGAVLAAAGAGPELEEEAGRLWLDERPDEYFFLEIYGSAVVEHLIEAADRRVREWAAAEGFAVLPRQSPGHAGWDVAEQGRFLALLAARLPSGVEALESGSLRPKKSQLAAFGLVARTGLEEHEPRK